MGAGNLLVSNAKIWLADYGTTLPLDTLAALNANPTGFVSPGLTNGGVTWNAENSFTEYRADQLKIAAGAANTDQTLTVEMNLAEITHLNMGVALADGVITTADSGNVSIYKPGAATDFQVQYKTLILDTDAPSGLQGVNKRRRIVFRRCLPTSGLSLAYGREDQQGIPVTFTVYAADENEDVWYSIEATDD
jgi:hypothetical protein